jgi:hypothetical protein
MADVFAMNARFCMLKSASLWLLVASLQRWPEDSVAGYE